ncbi:MAG: NADH-quinone oxidoreductase subunit NuoE [Gemmatimonadales bacterium]|nr:NADH-quinone oxidoreductase subunit NuoE [Gemmatimonadales bacterium]
MSKTQDMKQEFKPSPETLSRVDKLVEAYPTRASALMPSIWAITDEMGYVPDTGVDFLVEKLGVTKARVYEVLSFYTMYRTEPQAEHVLQVCHNISCHIMGARNVIAQLEKKLGVRLGEATPDGKFAIEGAECLGACGHGPCLQLGKHLYEYLTPEKAEDLLDNLRKGVVPRADTDRELED